MGSSLEKAFTNPRCTSGSKKSNIPFRKTTSRATSDNATYSLSVVLSVTQCCVRLNHEIAPPASKTTPKRFRSAKNEYCSKERVLLPRRAMNGLDGAPCVFLCIESFTLLKRDTELDVGSYS